MKLCSENERSRKGSLEILSCPGRVTQAGTTIPPTAVGREQAKSWKVQTAGEEHR